MKLFTGERAREVIGRLAEGKTNEEIAAELFIGVRTVKYHVSKIMARNGLSGMLDERRLIARAAKGDLR